MLNECCVLNWNSALMSVTCETSQCWIGPYLVSGQFPFGDCLRHSDTAFLTSNLGCGELAVVEGGDSVVEIVVVERGDSVVWERLRA